MVAREVREPSEPDGEESGRGGVHERDVEKDLSIEFVPQLFLMAGSTGTQKRIYTFPQEYPLNLRLWATVFKFVCDGRGFQFTYQVKITAS